MAEGTEGREALAHIDRALAARPAHDGHAMRAAVECLAALRDRCAERHRRESGTRNRTALDHVNAVITVAMAAEFPIGEVPWDELLKARGWLDAILRGGSAQ